MTVMTDNNLEVWVGFNESKATVPVNLLGLSGALGLLTLQVAVSDPHRSFYSLPPVFISLPVDFAESPTGLFIPFRGAHFPGLLSDLLLYFPALVVGSQGVQPDCMTYRTGVHCREASSNEN